MLQANELRIGNLIQDIIELEKWLPVYKIENGIITCGDEDFDYPYLAESVKPIPLTPEILEKAGFFRHGSFWSITWGENGVEILKWDDHYNAFLYDLCRGRTKVITSLHSLQNLYFALTGTELNINL